MRKSKGKMHKLIASYVKSLYFTEKPPLKSNLIKKSFDITIDGLTTSIDVTIKDKHLVTYNDTKLTKTFKRIKPLAEAVLDATIANYISYDYLVDN